jgi:hypothetical protein
MKYIAMEVAVRLGIRGCFCILTMKQVKSLVRIAAENTCINLVIALQPNYDTTFRKTNFS